MADRLAAREGEVAKRVQTLLSNARELTPAALSAADDAIAEYAFMLSQCDDADESHVQQVRQFERQVRRLRRAQEGAPARRRTPAPVTGAAAASSSSALLGASRGASLRATRDLLELEVQRMGAAGEMLARDAAAMAGTLAEHGAYGADVATAGAAVSTYASREARDRLHMRLAFALFTLIAAYVVGRRAAWTLAGVALPGL
jgi:hypothetical protein